MSNKGGLGSENAENHCPRTSSVACSLCHTAWLKSTKLHLYTRSEASCKGSCMAQVLPTFAQGHNHIRLHACCQYRGGLRSLI